MPQQRLFSLLLCSSLATVAASADDIGIRAPEGFEVTLYAGDELAHDIFSMTIDSQGRVVVAGRGYVKILHDDDSDGRADRATLFSEFPRSGAHGMVFLGNDLVATGDDLLMRLKDKDGDGVADGKPLPLANVKSPEHGANGLAIGPDGWIYMICGNDAGVGAQLARTKTSPVKKPQAGAVVRFSPDFKTSEIFAHGFRNPYDLAFNEDGRLFTVDADGERDQHLPWYTPTRLFDIQQGGHHGWVQGGWTRSWNRPESFFDNVPRLVEIGRGSPTGVECYRHYAFPQHYRGGIYSCCWTLGTVYYFPLTREGASYKSHKEIFLQTAGDVGFAPVDLAVGPAGDLFVAIGGRGTRGSVFRVRYTGDLQDDERVAEPKSDLEKVAAAPQPLAAWSRAKWLPLAKKLGQEKLEAYALDDAVPPEQCMRAIEVVTEQFGGLSPATFMALAGHDVTIGLNPEAEPEVVARAVSAVSRSDAPERYVSEFGAGTFRYNEAVSRSAWESLASLPRSKVEEFSNAPWTEYAHANRRVQLAVLRNPCDLHAEDLDYSIADVEHALPKSALLHYRAVHNLLVPSDLEHAVWLLRNGQPQPLDRGLKWLGEDFDEKRLRPQLRRNAVRMMQLCLGDIRVTPMRPDVYAGYTASAAGKVPEEIRKKAALLLAKEFPTNDAEANREIARTLGMLEVGGPHEESLLKKLVDLVNVKSSVQDDIHYLIVLSRIGGERSEKVTHTTAGALAFLHYKMLLGEMYPSRNWPLRVGEMFVELCKRDPNLAEALATHRDFGLPQHAMFAELMPKTQRKMAAAKLLAKAQQADDEETPWSPEMVKLIAELGDEAALAAVRAQWRDYSLRDAIIAAMHGDPQDQDRKLYLDALTSPQTQTVRRAAQALASMKTTDDVEEYASVLTALRFYSTLEGEGETRQILSDALSVLSNDQSAPKAAKDDPPTKAYEFWRKWFAERYPDQAKQLGEGGDGAELVARLGEIEWASGAAERGAAIYQRQACAKCHSGGNRLGPAIEGVTGRWSREDLFREIIDPNRNVAPQFQITRMITRDGKVYQGMPVYQSPDGTLLQTGPDETIRIAGTEVVSIAKTRNSLMPTGLLRGLKDEEVADLYAYLKTLTAKRE